MTIKGVTYPMNDDIQSDIAIAPGEYLAEVLDEFAMSQTELAKRIGRPLQAVNEIINGSKAITPETALQLEQVLNVPAYIWLNLEHDYRLTLARLADNERLDQEVDLLSQFPYTEMVKYGWLQMVRDPRGKVRELLKFFGVSSLYNLPSVQAAAFRKSGKANASSYALAAWLRRGEIEASEVETAPYDVSRLRDVLPSLRKLTLEKPESFVPQLRSLLADCGVAVVFVPHLPKTYAHGATFWLAAKAVVQMSIRGRYNDIFWFSFFHEVGHVLLHGKRDTFIENGAEKDSREIEADNFAANLLIPAAAYREFIKHKPISGQAVVRFAEEIGISPAIVVGRCQHDGLVQPSDLNRFREKYKWAQDS